MNKTMQSYRLKPSAIEEIAKYSSEFGCSKAELIERAIKLIDVVENAGDKDLRDYYDIIIRG